MTQVKRIFITGAASGMGLALARHYLDQGAVVGTCSLETRESVADTLPDGLDYTQADVTDAAATRDAVMAFAERVGGLDLMIANAGISMPKTAFPDFDRGRAVFNVNVMGTVNAFEPAIEIMRKQGSGQLVALGSVSGITGMPGMAFYGSSKAAVMQFCETLAIDLKAYGIDVTVVAPGFVATPLTEANPHKMPFLLTTEAAVNRIIRAVERRRLRSVFPLPMAMLASLLYHLPRSLYVRLMRLDLLGLRKDIK
ncbi:MAG: SDR family NAD(P)-dependent oxidoreductase [Nevskiales bacterium]